MDKKSDVINKPKSSQGENTKELLGVIKEVMDIQTKKGYMPSFVVGTSFGANLTKWREVLREIFNSRAVNIEEESFNEIKKFDKAVLILDPVSVKDKDGMGVIQADSLNIWLSGSSTSYLHTKFILIKFEKQSKDSEYVLIVSSKNITYSKSYDLVLPLYSYVKDNNDEKNVGHGKALRDYLEFLVKHKSKEEQNNFINNLNGLEKVMFDVKNEEDEYEAHVTDLVFSYEGHCFEDKVWNEVQKSDLVISPYLCKEEFGTWCSTRDEAIKKRILTYWNSADKVKDVLSQLEDEQVPNIYVGKVSDESGRIKFHAKLYVSTIKNENEEKYTKLWMGSANLTTEGKKEHYELLLGIEFAEDEGAVHDYIKNQILCPSTMGNFNNPLIEEFETGKKGEMLDGDEEDSGAVEESRMWKYALFQMKNGYQWRIYNTLDAKEKDILPVSSEEIGNWIKTEDYEVFVCEDNYKIIPDEEGYLPYEEYKKLVSVNVKKMRSKYYRSIFFGANTGRKKADKRGRNKGANGKQYIKYPCLYKMMMDIKYKNNGMDVGEELSKLFYGFMDSEDTENEIVSLMKEYIDALGENQDDG